MGLAEALAWLAALIGYFGPWISSPGWGAALSWNAYDLFDLMRLLPEIETGALSVWLQALHLPLLALAVLLPALEVGKPYTRWMRAGIGAILALATLPPYPEILTAWRTPGWQVPFWWGIGTALVCVAIAWLGGRMVRVVPWLAVCVAFGGSIPALRTLFRLLPALGSLHQVTVRPGWGLWMCIIGLWGIAALELYQGVVRPEERSQ